MCKRIRKRRFRINRGRLQATCEHAWYAFVLAGTGALAFGSDRLSTTAVIVGLGLIAFGVLLFVLAVGEFH